MKFIDELVEYFSDRLTPAQKQKIERLWHAAPAADSDDYNDYDDDDDDSSKYPYEEYDTLYDSPAKKGKSGHAAGKRSPLRHPAVSAEGLVSLFQKEAKRVWKNDPLSLELYLSLAAAHNPAYPAGKRHSAKWRCFIFAVECLKDLDADSLAGLLSGLFKNPDSDRFSGIFTSFAEGYFSNLANRFCRQTISGVAAKAVLADLRSIAYPEEKSIPGCTRTHQYKSFLDNADLTAIFNYYRIQRKLEYILKQTVDEALQRILRNYLPKH